MIRGVFLAGVVASIGACAATYGEAEPESASASTEAAPFDDEAGARPMRPSPPASSSSAEGGDAPAPTCPTTRTIAAGDLAWKPPLVSPGSCTQASYDDMIAFAQANPNATWADLRAHVPAASANCAACAFTDMTASAWGAIVMSGSDAYTINVGGCWAIVTKNNACGKAQQNAFDCPGVACADCANDDATIETCEGAASGGACKDLTNALASACTDPTVSQYCGYWNQSVWIQCVVTPT